MEHLVRQRLEQLGMTLSEFIRELGTSTQTLYTAFNKGRFSKNLAPRAAKILGVPVELLLHTDDVGRVPIVNVVRSGAIVDYPPVINTEEFMGSPQGVQVEAPSDGTFAVWVCGESMSPTLKTGDLLIFVQVEPDDDGLPIRPGTIVYASFTGARKGGEGCVVGRLESVAQGKITINSDNPAFSPVVEKTEHLASVAKLIERRSYWR